VLDCVPKMNLKETVINGALVAFHPISGLNATYLNLTIRAGSWYEEGNSWGEMHLLEHLLFLGSENLTITWKKMAFNVMVIPVEQRLK
jgi:predicted Zn-dependent peptidase